jgi:hypothetical protein
LALGDVVGKEAF